MTGACCEENDEFPDGTGEIAGSSKNNCRRQKILV
jgi:hypothetical protein